MPGEAVGGVQHAVDVEEQERARRRGRRLNVFAGSSTVVGEELERADGRQLTNDLGQHENAPEPVGPIGIADRTFVARMYVCRYSE